MTEAVPPRRRLHVVWLLAAAVFAAVIYLRLELSFDLSAFVPARTSVAHDILVAQIESGPASRMLVIGIGGDSRDDIAAASDQLKRALSESDAFITVMNGEFDLDTATMPAPVDRYFLLMRDLDYGSDALRSALQTRLRDLAIGGGASLRELIARDPYLASLDVLGRLSTADLSGDMWFAEDGSAVLIVETRSASIDIQAQQEAIDIVRSVFDDLPDAAELTLDITGVGAFSVELQETIRAEATLRSVLASLALMLVILVVFRRPRYVLLAALPLGMGFLGGLAAVSLIFEKVHGITLAFGFTMLGVAIDYPLHLFSHARGETGQTAIRRIWPTLRLGVTSTAIAYIALVFAGSEGLAQLGCFTVTGIVLAVFVTRSWLPGLLPAETPPAQKGDAASLPTLGWTFGVAALAVSVAIGWQLSSKRLWDDDLSSLSPVAEERLAVDRGLRSATATPDLRYQLVVTGSSLEAVLERCEDLEPLLAGAQRAGLIGDWQSVCQVLPSPRVQEQRRAQIPEPAVLRERLGVAAVGTPFRAEAFEAFVETAAAARELEPLEPGLLIDSPLRSWLDAHLVALDGEWAALVSLVEPGPDRLSVAIGEWPVNARLVDFQEASISLMRDYRHGALRVIGVSAVLILGLLWMVRGNLGQMLWIGLTVSAALGTTVTVTALAHGGLTVMHLVAMLLVLGLGLDYALFLSRTESAAERAETRRGVFACAASTTVAFGILAGSSIPVLKYLGLTVATGSVASYLLAYFGSRGWRQRVS